MASTIGLPTSDWISHWQELVDVPGVDFTVFTCPGSRSREMTCWEMLVGSRAFCEEPVVICVDRASEGLGRLTVRLSTMPLVLHCCFSKSLRQGPILLPPDSLGVELGSMGTPPVRPPLWVTSGGSTKGCGLDVSSGMRVCMSATLHDVFLVAPIARSHPLFRDGTVGVKPT